MFLTNVQQVALLLSSGIPERLPHSHSATKPKSAMNYGSIVDLLLVTHLPACASSLVIRQLTQRANSREISCRLERKCAAELFPGQELLAGAAEEDSGQGVAVSGHILEPTTRAAVHISLVTAHRDAQPVTPRPASRSHEASLSGGEDGGAGHPSWSSASAHS